MAIDIMQLIVQVLRISPQYVQSLSSRGAGMVEQFLFLIFFPTILVLAILYMFTTKWFDKKLSFLFAVAFYIFLIVYPIGSQTSLYSILVPIGELWFFVIIIIAVVWFLIGRGFSGGGGGLPGLRHGGGLGGLIGKGINRKEKLGELDDQIRIMKGTLRLMETGDPGKLADYIREFRASQRIASELLDDIKIAGVDIHGRERQIDKLMEKFSRFNFKSSGRGAA